MENVINRALSFLLALTMALTLIPVSSWAAEVVASGVGDDGIRWSLDSEGTLTLSGTGDMDNHLPAGGSAWGSWVCKNIEVATGWDVRSSDIIRVVIEPGITSIGNAAFNYCSKLVSIQIPDTVTEIGQWAFMNCAKLESIVIPECVTYLGYMAFNECTGLKEVHFEGTGITSFGTQTFYNTTALTDIYYAGADFQWDAIEVGKYNNGLENVDLNIHYGWYDFERDSYNFTNFSVNKISKKYFTTMYGKATGKLLYRECKEMSKGGICFGMATTTCAIHNGFPNAEEFYIGQIFAEDESFEEIRKLSKKAKVSINDNSISLLDYLKYAHIYQLSMAVAESSEATWGDLDGLVDMLEIYMEYQEIGVTIGMTHGFINAEGEWESDGGHRVLAVGMDGNDILIDDPNYSDELKRLTINEDGTWSYNAPWTSDGVNSTNSKIRYQLDYSMPYIVLNTGISIESVPIEEETENYISGMGALDKDKLLVSIESDEYRLNSRNAFRIVEDDAVSGEDNETGDLYWIKNDKTVTISELSGTESTVMLAGTEVLMGVTVGSGAELEMTIDSHVGFAINAEEEEYCEVTFNTFGENEEDVVLTVSGTATNGRVVASQTDSGIDIWGISDGTVTLVHNEENVRTEKLVDTNQIIDIDYDFDGKDKDIQISYKESGVNRIYGDDRFGTAFRTADELKTVLGVEKFDCVVIASGAEFADALAGSYLATVKDAPILLSYKDKQNALVQEYIKENLAPGGTVYILGGTSAVPASMEAGLSGLNIQRLAGADRFETNLLILKEAGVTEGDEILVCTGKEFADSLSASATGKPILLVYKKLTDGQKAYLSGLSGNKFCVVGGENAVSTTLESAIKAYGETTRLAGVDRLVTSVMVAEKYFSNPESVVVAYGWNYPDGLCGGPLAYAMKAPLILTYSKPKLYATAVNYTSPLGIKNGYVLGGTGLVYDEAVRAIFSMAAADVIMLK